MEQGLRFNKNKLRWRNIPLLFIKPLVEIGDAAEKREGNPKGKYPTFNFLKCMPTLDTLDSAFRHIDSLLDPTQPDTDPETGVSHAAHAAWNLLLVAWTLKTRPDLDDRYKGEG